jgi:hypothetical protein
MEDITRYTDIELSLRVFNDEYFYTERKNIEYLKALIDEEFVYTQAQMDVLKEDLEEDSNEDI